MLHSELVTPQERKAWLSERGRKAGLAGAENRRKRKRKTCPLRSRDDRFAFLERRGIEIEQSKADGTAKANAAARLIAALHELEEVAELRNEMADLKKFVAERWPDLDDTLRAAHITKIINKAA